MGSSVDDRFWSKVSVAEADECWEWMAYKIKTGYGLFYPKHGEQWVAHRWAYTALRADIPEGLVLDHLCRNPSCVNPWHVEPVTQSVNVNRSIQSTKTHCKRGHEFTPENTRRKGNARWCRACVPARRRERKARLALGLDL